MLVEVVVVEAMVAAVDCIVANSIRIAFFYNTVAELVHRRDMVEELDMVCQLELVLDTVVEPELVVEQPLDEINNQLIKSWKNRY